MTCDPILIKRFKPLKFLTNVPKSKSKSFGPHTNFGIFQRALEHLKVSVELMRFLKMLTTWKTLSINNDI